VGYAPQFYVSDFYEYWDILSDQEGLQCLREWRLRQHESPRLEVTRDGSA